MTLFARREVLLSLAASALPALAWGAEPDPLAAVRAKVTPAAAERLLAIARAVELHRWDELLGYADPEHRAGQQELFSSPQEESPKVTFREWYLQELLGLGMVDNHVDKLDDIVKIRYTGLEEPYGPSGPLQLKLEIETKGPRKLTGWFFLDRTSLKVSGAVG